MTFHSLHGGGHTARLYIIVAVFFLGVGLSTAWAGFTKGDTIKIATGYSAVATGEQGLDSWEAWDTLVTRPDGTLAYLPPLPGEWVEFGTLAPADPFFLQDLSTPPAVLFGGSNIFKFLQSGRYIFRIQYQSFDGHTGAQTQWEKTFSVDVSDGLDSLAVAIATNPSSITTTDSSLITWSSNGSSAIISGPGISSTALSGSQSVSLLPPGTYTYTITAAASSGVKKIATAILKVGPHAEKIDLQSLPVAAGITPKLQSIRAGATAIFSLSSTGAAQSILIGTDGISLSNPASTAVVAPSSINSISYTYTVTGSIRARWSADGADQIFIDPPSGPPVDVTALRSLVISVNGNHNLRAIGGGVTTTIPFTVTLPQASDSATVTVTNTSSARLITFPNGSMTFGDSMGLTASTDGDGSPVYSIVSGPGSVSGSSLAASAVGTIRVRVDYPATGTFDAGSAIADIVVNPQPVTFTLNSEDFDYDGATKTALYSVSNPAAVFAGMIDASALTIGPAANTYTVTVRAFGNYSGSTTGTVRIFPVIDSFSITAPPNPIISLSAPASVQWPGKAAFQWNTSSASAVRVTDDSGSVISVSPADSVSALLDARAVPYTYTVSADPLPVSAGLLQRGATVARLQGPGIDLDVTGLSSFSINRSGTYVYTISANGLTRVSSQVLTVPPATIRTANIAVGPATVTAVWPPKNSDGPYTVASTDLPSWRIQTGDPVAAATTLFWTRLDDSASGSAAVGGVVNPGTYSITATFVPPNANYAPASTTSTWALTVPIAIFAASAKVAIDDVPISSGTVLRILPGSTLNASASPITDHDWGTDWDTDSATIWTGSPQIIPNAASPSFAVKVPAGISNLSLTASAFQTGPRVVEFSPIAASYTCLSGPAAGHSYPRTWLSDGIWNAYLGRDGVTFKLTGQSRESSIGSYEIQAKPPASDWFTLTSGSPAEQALNGARAKVAQTFSVRLGEMNPTKPIIPANLKLAGNWSLRARVQSSVGVWSDWSAEQTLKVVVPLQTITMTGQTLPPVQDAAWFVASPVKNYTVQVWIP